MDDRRDPPKSESLREQAEKRLCASRSDIERMSAEKTQSLVHELQVHQVELEIQNEELRQAQVELAQSRDDYSDLYEFAPVGYVTLDPNATILSANLTLAGMLGIERGKITGTSLTRFVTPDSQDSLHLHRQEVFSDDEPDTSQQSTSFHGHACEVQLRPADGRKLFVHLHSELVSDTRHPLHCRTTISDITAQKTAELALSQMNEELEQRVALRTTELYESRERMRAILNAAADAIITIDQQGVILDGNQAATRIFGYSVEELTGQNVRMLMAQPYFDEHDGYIQRYLKTGEARAIGQIREVTGKRKDGSTFPAELVVSEVDHLGMFTGILRDTTEKHRLQREVLSIVSREQRRFGQDLHDGLGQELAGVAIMADTLATLLTRQQNAAAEKARGICDRLKQAGDHARDMAHGLIPVEMDSHGLMTALRTLTRQLGELHEIDCSFQCDEPVLIDDNHAATHLYRIAQEACGNAIRHGLPQRLRVRLEKKREFAVLTVQDDGRGIEDLDASLNGNGLGLRIMRHRASLIGGQLTIERTYENHGTTIACSVPLKTPS